MITHVYPPHKSSTRQTDNCNSDSHSHTSFTHASDQKWKNGNNWGQPSPTGPVPRHRMGVLMSLRMSPSITFLPSHIMVAVFILVDWCRTWWWFLKVITRYKQPAYCQLPSIKAVLRVCSPRVLKDENVEQRRENTLVVSWPTEQGACINTTSLTTSAWWGRDYFHINITSWIQWKG